MNNSEGFIVPNKNFQKETSLEYLFLLSVRERDLFEKMLRPARSSGREISTALVINNPNGNITLEIFPPT